MNRDEIIDVWATKILNDVFFLPTIGPVFLKGNTPYKLLADVLMVAGTNKMLEYDKDRRWLPIKGESILVREIMLSKYDGVSIPTFNERTGVLRIFSFGGGQPSDKQKERFSQLIGNIKNKYKIEKVKYTWFIGSNEIINDVLLHDICLKEFSSKDDNDFIIDNVSGFTSLSNSTKATLKNMGNEPMLEGFGFLYRLGNKQELNNLICYIDKNRIIGAIGPITTMKDAFSRITLPPPYFGVLSSHRRMGVASKIWTEAMRVAYKSNVEYLLLQTEANSAACGFYQQKGCKIATRMATIDLPL